MSEFITHSREETVALGERLAVPSSVAHIYITPI